MAATASLHPRQAGSAIVEFAFVLTVLMLMTAGVFEFGRAFWYYDALAKATRDGARYMSLATKDTIASVGVPTAKDLVVLAANSANLSPPLTSSQVDVVCQPACADGTTPNDVAVSIDGYAIDIGTLFPFISGTPPTDADRYAGVPLAPSTTMRYMYEEPTP